MWAYLLDALQNSEHLVNIKAVKFNLACEFSRLKVLKAFFECCTFFSLFKGPCRLVDCKGSFTVCTGMIQKAL